MYRFAPNSPGELRAGSGPGGRPGIYFFIIGLSMFLEHRIALNSPGELRAGSGQVGALLSTPPGGVEGNLCPGRQAGWAPRITWPRPGLA